MATSGEAYILGKTKRRFDVIGALTILGVSLPVAVPLGLETIVEYGRLNPFFQQQRLGKQGNTFTMTKFESLHNKGDSTQFNGGSRHPGASWFGHIVRKAGLDELPQLYNVLKGDIGLVGIRPIHQTFMDFYQSFVTESLFSEWRECYDLNPGLTGEGQLYGKRYPVHDAAVVAGIMREDIKMTENASLLNDVAIAANTPPRLLYNMLVAHNAEPPRLGIAA